MCNPMLVSQTQLIEQVIQKHLGELKGIDEWSQTINEALPKHKRLSPKRYAYKFSQIRHEGTLTVIKTKTGSNTYYTFKNGLEEI